jgi:hypothetical protein
MPSKSKPQARLMAAAAHNPAFAKKVGIPTKVAKEFNDADKGKTFKKGGIPASINKQKTNHGAKQIPNVSLNKYIGRKDGGPVLSVGRGEKLPVSKGAGLTAKGRAKYNAATGSNLKAPQPEGGPRKKSFCARMSGMPGPMKDEDGNPTRKAASLKRWKC